MGVVAATICLRFGNTTDTLLDVFSIARPFGWKWGIGEN